MFHVGHANAVTDAAFRKLDELDFGDEFWSHCHGHGAMDIGDGAKFVFHVSYDSPLKIIKKFESLKKETFSWFYEGETRDATFDYELRGYAVMGGLTRREIIKRRLLVMWYEFRNKFLISETAEIASTYWLPILGLVAAIIGAIVAVVTIPHATPTQIVLSVVLLVGGLIAISITPKGKTK